MGIISILNYQLAQIENFLKKDLNERQLTDFYYICEKECSFLDANKLQDYLTETVIVKDVFVNDIENRCTNIINLWNKDFQSIPPRMVKKSYINEGDKTEFIVDAEDYRAIYITEYKFINFNSKKGKENFENRYKYNIYRVCDIASRCSLILNFINSAYPNPNANSSPVDFKNYKYKSPHPAIFEDGAFEIFKNWMNYDNDDKPHKKISFIFQKLKGEKKLRQTNHKEFNEWAFENEFIDNNTKEKIYSNGGFDSPHKIFTKSREKVYNAIIGK